MESFKKLKVMEVPEMRTDYILVEMGGQKKIMASYLTEGEDGSSVPALAILDENDINLAREQVRDLRVNIKTFDS